MTMKPLRVKDNSQIKEETLFPVQNLVHKVCNKTLEQLEQEGVFVFPELLNDIDDLTKEQMILQHINDSYHTGNVMGFLGLGTERLNITSRFSTGSNDFFLQYLLERVMDIPNIADLDTNADQNGQLLHLLVFLFPYYLKKAMRKGAYKTYIRRNYNDSHVKGTVDIARHIRMNTPFTGKVAYSQREYAYDNSLMELVRHTIEWIRQKPYGRQLLLKVKDEVSLVVSATQSYEVYDRGKILAENMTSPVRHAYFREYRALQHLCVLTLQHQTHQIGIGTNQIYGVLFDGAWLWEEYVNLLLHDYFYHPMNKIGAGAQILFGTNTGRIYPDFISRDPSNRIIADAKYKPFNHISGRDYLQVLAYMMRFDAKQGYYLYPEIGVSKDKKLWLNRGSTYENDVVPRSDICIVKHGLEVSQNANSYRVFVDAMQESEAKFIKLFLQK